MTGSPIRVDVPADDYSAYNRAMHEVVQNMRAEQDVTLIASSPDTADLLYDLMLGHLLQHTHVTVKVRRRRSIHVGALRFCVEVRSDAG